MQQNTFVFSPAAACYGARVWVKENLQYQDTGMVLAKYSKWGGPDARNEGWIAYEFGEMESERAVAFLEEMGFTAVDTTS